MKYENILLKSALALAIVDLVLIAAILLQVNNLVKDVLEVQNRQAEVEEMKEKLEKAEKARVEEKTKETEKQETKIEEKEMPKIDISDWKEFSGKFGDFAKISFKYPSNWIVSPTDGGYYLRPANREPKEGIYIMIRLYVNIADSHSLEQAYRAFIPQDLKEETLNLDDATILKISGTDQWGRKQSFAFWKKIVEDTNYFIQLDTAGAELYKTIGHQAIFDSIINTFKHFSEFNLDTSVWKEYGGIFADNKVKFSFKYPSVNWFIEQANVIRVLSVRHTKSGFGILIEELKNLTQENPEMSYRDTISQGRAEEIFKIGNATAFKISGKDTNNQTRAFAVWREKINNTNYTIQFATVGPSENANDLIIFDKFIKTFKLAPVTESVQDLQDKVIEVTLEDVLGEGSYANLHKIIEKNIGKQWGARTTDWFRFVEGDIIKLFLKGSVEGEGWGASGAYLEINTKSRRIYLKFADLPSTSGNTINSPDNKYAVYLPFMYSYRGITELRLYDYINLKDRGVIYSAPAESTLQICGLGCFIFDKATKWLDNDTLQIHLIKRGKDGLAYWDNDKIEFDGELFTIDVSKFKK